MKRGNPSRAIDILVVEDNPGDVRLLQEALHESRIEHVLHHVSDGEKALSFLHQTHEYRQAQRPDLILLDFNLPKKDGRQVLVEIKQDSRFRHIPVIVLTSSQSPEDSAQAYGLGAHCFYTKPHTLEKYTNLVNEVENIWVGLSHLQDE